MVFSTESIKEFCSNYTMTPSTPAVRTWAAISAGAPSSVIMTPSCSMEAKEATVVDYISTSPIE
jgi:hypothetical protein